MKSLSASFSRRLGDSNVSGTAVGLRGASMSQGGGAVDTHTGVRVVFLEQWESCDCRWEPAQQCARRGRRHSAERSVTHDARFAGGSPADVRAPESMTSTWLVAHALSLPGATKPTCARPGAERARGWTLFDGRATRNCSIGSPDRVDLGVGRCAIEDVELPDSDRKAELCPRPLSRDRDALVR